MRSISIAAHEFIGQRVIAVPVLPRIANFDDLDPLGMEPGVKLVFVRPGEPIPADAEIVILPGSKSTIGDLAFLRAQGWDIDINGACPPRRPCARAVRRLSDARQDRSTIPMASTARAGTVEGLGPARYHDYR